jgi:hypothetical protein
MPYVGKSPSLGNFQKCDSIAVVNGQAAYTLQVGGTNVSPQSENHMLVSLNGILQAPVDSFTVSGSTLTFASNLVTGDVIDFVMILGNVLDLGVPSDNTVSLAKLTATGTKDATTFLRGDNTFDSPSVASLSTASGSAPSYSARAWVSFNGTGTPAIRASGNVSSITDVSTGRYKVNFTTNMPDANYAVAIASQQANNNISQVHNVEAPNVAYVEFQRKENDTNYDSPYIFVTVTR